MKNLPEPPLPNSSSFQNHIQTFPSKHLGLICINYSLSNNPPNINYINDFTLFTTHHHPIPPLNPPSPPHNEPLPFSKKTNYTISSLMNNKTHPSPVSNNSFSSIIENNIDDFTKFIKSGKNLFSKIHYTKIKKLSLCYKKNLQHKELIDEMILKLSNMLNEKKEIIKEWLTIEVKALKLESMYSYFIKAFGRYLSSLNKSGIIYDALKIADQRDKISVDLRKTTQKKIDKYIDLGIDFLKYLNEHSYLICTIQKFNPSTLSIVTKAKTLKELMNTKINEGYKKWKIKIEPIEIERIFFQNWNDQLESYAEIIYNNKSEYFLTNKHNDNNGIVIYNKFHVDENGGTNNTNMMNNANPSNLVLFGDGNNISNHDISVSNNSSNNVFILETVKSSQYMLPHKSKRYKIKKFDVNDF